MLRRFLIRLYPSQWRQRYGEEFGRLLEDTPLTAGVVVDVLGRATRERVMRTMSGRLVLGPMLAYLALLTAQLLSAIVGAQPTFSYEGAQTIVTPSWPVSFGFVQPLIGFALIGRVVFGFIRDVKVGEVELVLWVVSLFVGAVAQQWAWLEMNVGTGVAPWPLWQLWAMAAVQVTSNLIFLLLVSRDLVARGFPDRSPFTGSDRPLGLS